MSAQGYIYAIEGAYGHVKIGWSRNPNARIVSLRTGSCVPVKLLGAKPGSMWDECEVQKSLEEFRVSGEWFRHEGPVASFVAGLPQFEQPAPPIKDEYHPLRRWRLQRKPKITLMQLAKAVQCNASMISLVEQDKATPSLDLACKISKYTDGAVPIDAFAFRRSR